MQIGKIKRHRPYDSRKETSFEIQSYGDTNSFPQQVLEIVSGSGTGSSCVDVYKKFIAGKGFEDKALYNKKLNAQGDTADKICNLVAEDFATFRGFYIHVNYNANYKISSVHHIPFETVRLGNLDDFGRLNHVCLHPDWARQFTNIRRWSKDDIKKIKLFNPDPAVVAAQVAEAGGWDKYLGQVYIYSESRIGAYPIPKFFSTLTDMSTEQGISNLSYRSARNNFLPAGMLVDILESTDETKEQEDETEEALMEFQGDEQACKIFYTTAKSKDEAPIFTAFNGMNYDKEFTVTDASARGRIGRSFNQPEILRSENVGVGFGAELLTNAYNYYNAVTESERLAVERCFEEVLMYWWEGPIENTSIIPLSFNTGYTFYDRFGEKGMTLLLKVMEMQVGDEQKKALIRQAFGMSEEEINEIVCQVQPL